MPVDATEYNADDIVTVLGNTDDPDYFVYTYRRSDDAHNDGNTVIQVEYRGDLSSAGSWTSAVDGGGGDVIITVTDDGYGEGVDRVEVKLNKSLATDGRMFTRLSVEIAP